ncbi:MAG: LEA type 2 family protein, partial [Spirochaetaceae bacterium]|nr:LEA type 2 family protein [Spirochaetaceae bacterium]
MKRQYTQRAVKLIVAIGVLAALFGCETLKSLIAVERPEVRVEGAELTALSFDGAEVTVELAIDNPNPIGISMSGFSYELLVEGNRFVDGDISEAIQIDAMDSSSLKVPVAFGFRDLVDTVQSLGDAE